MKNWRQFVNLRIRRHFVKTLTLAQLNPWQESCHPKSFIPESLVSRSAGQGEHRLLGRDWFLTLLNATPKKPFYWILPRDKKRLFSAVGHVKNPSILCQYAPASTLWKLKSLDQSFTTCSLFQMPTVTRHSFTYHLEEITGTVWYI